MQHLSCNEKGGLSLSNYCKQLVNKLIDKQLRDFMSDAEVHQDKGSLGQLVQTLTFELDFNPRQEADFAFVNTELKCTPLKKLTKEELLIMKAEMLMAHGEEWETVSSEFRESENRNEQKGYNVSQTDYSQNAVLSEMHMRERPQDSSLAHEIVSCALQTNDPQLCRALYCILSRIDYQKGHIYEDEVTRLSDETNEIEKASREPRKVSVEAGGVYIQNVGTYTK